jgi:DNA-binding GntR family transcriptional regulator
MDAATTDPGRARRESPNLSMRAYLLIEEAIVTLRLDPGTTVTESDLCRLIGLGRTPVREAIQKLAADGLIQIYPRRGLVIPPISASEMQAVLEVRAPLERIIAGHAARRGNESERRALRRLGGLMETAASRDNPDAYMAHDKAIDRSLAQMSRSEYAVKACMPLQVMSRRYWYLHWRHADLMAAARHHLKLIDAVAGGEAQAAHQAVDNLMSHLAGRVAAHSVSN